MPPLWFYGLLVLMAHVITVNIAKINPACECVVYQSLGYTEGRFQSPNYPRNYSKGIECILFTFIGDIGEIVEINFTDFDMMLPDINGVCKDYLSLYLYLERPEVNENNQNDEKLCGNMKTLQQKTFYSKDRSLIMEFHTTIPGSLEQLRRYKGYHGFRGLFKFKDKTNFVIRPPDVYIRMPEQYNTDGTKQLGTMCSYDFSASATSGKFFSLSYPQNYPPSSKCQYTFYGQSYEGTVKVTFQNIQIFDDGKSCKNSADRIAIYDGLNSSAPLIKYLCGIMNHEEVISTTPYLYIEFHSNKHNQSKGFAANYTFQHKSTSFSTPIDQPFNCNQDIFSSDKKQGTVHSQNYPGPYPTSTRCMYTFYGNNSTPERIQIKFKRVDLFYDGGNAENPYDCDGQDSIRIYIKIDNDKKELANTCGRKIPPMYMSNIPWMQVVFESGSRSHTNTGFEMEYKFLTNYGITSGKQDDRKKCLFTYYSNVSVSGFFTSPNYPGSYPMLTDCSYKFFVCKFYYFGSIKMSGTFVSPNYPGIYPKNTECQYTFHGRKQRNEIVRIQFTEFDVDGITPRCEPKDKVDFVEFTNFDGGAQDMKMDKFCGRMTAKIAKPMESDLAFFQVTFKTNSMYEGRGFNAKYQFMKDPDEEMNTTKKQFQQSNTATEPLNLLSFIVTLLTISFSLTL